MLVGTIGLGLLITRVPNGNLPFDGTLDTYLNTSLIPHPCQNYLVYTTSRSAVCIFTFTSKFPATLMVNSVLTGCPIHCELRIWYQLSTRINSRRLVYIICWVYYFQISILKNLIQLFRKSRVSTAVVCKSRHCLVQELSLRHWAFSSSLYFQKPLACET